MSYIINLYGELS